MVDLNCLSLRYCLVLVDIFRTTTTTTKPLIFLEKKKTDISRDQIRTLITKNEGVLIQKPIFAMS
jgi:hypothetical protein